MFGTPQDFPVNPPCGDSISALCWAPSGGPNAPLFIAAGSWDKQVRLWEVKPNGQSEPRAAHDHGAPVLSVTISPNNIVFSGGCDNLAKAWEPSSNATMTVAQHDAPVKYVGWITSANLLLTGSWDKTMRTWDCRSSSPGHTLPLPERLYCADTKANVIVAATAERKIVGFDIRNLGQPVLRLDSPLKFQTRSITLSPNASCMAVGGIDSRVGIHYFDNSDNNFSFKAHKVDPNELHSVHSLDFHPTFNNTIATVGADGHFYFWDIGKRKNLYKSPKAHLPITTCQFHQSGTVFAYAASYDWQKVRDFFRRRLTL